MVDSLCHESFYKSGTWMSESLGVYVGWVAHEGSFSDGMPLCNERGNVSLVFSGEEYSEPGTALRLRENGHDCPVGGSSYLVHLYEDDPDFPGGLNGKFHGLLLDETRETAVLFNDRFGMHPLYYHQSGEALYFAAEIKAILTVCPALRTLDPQGLGESVACGCVFEDRTIFRDVYELPRGARWAFRRGKLEHKGSYFHPKQWQDQPPLDKESYFPTLREIFARNLPRYFNGDQKIAVSLTGGLDTRMIMAWQGLHPGLLPCYTFGGMIRTSRDVAVSQRVARICQQPHEVITVGDQFLTRFPHYAERSVYLTDGRAGVGRSPDLYVGEKARAVAPVRIAGVYGSEVLRRSRAYKPWEPAPGLFCREFATHIKAARRGYAELVREHPVSFAAFSQAPQRGVNLLEQTQASVRFPFLDNDLVQTAFRAPAHDPSENGSPDDDVCLRLISDGNPALRKIRTDRGLGGNGAFMAGTISRALLEFTFKAEYAYDYGMPQWLAQMDHVFSSLHFERLFLGRHKLYHFRVWYRDALAGYVREMLLDRMTLSRPYLDRNALEMMVLGHLKGNRNYTTEIHQVLTLELLHRLFIDTR
jgi:asparagine synthase (glutamine-hydrolysing)